MGGTDGTTKVRIHALGTAPKECGEQCSGLYKGEVRQKPMTVWVGHSRPTLLIFKDVRPLLHFRQLFFKQLLVIEIGVVAV